MFYVYRAVPSTSARDLAVALGGRRLRRLDALRANDIVVCWGSRLERLPNGVRALNNIPIGNKLDDVRRLREAGVPTITISNERPVAAVARAAVAAQAAQPGVAARDPYMEFRRVNQGQLIGFLQMLNRPAQADFVGFRDRVDLLIAAYGQPIQAAVPARPAVAAQPAVLAEEWIGRVIDHVGGLDLLNPPAQPEFWVRKENIVEEFRVHSFQGRSIRSAVKVHRDDFAAARVSPWVRSWDGGWRMAYREGAVRQAHRDMAHRAVQALGLEFGAVDIGQKADGTLMVLEVNRAPGLSEGSAQVYANAVQQWARG